VERVNTRACRVTTLLDDQQIPYQIVGGLAVAAWVRYVDPGAVRATRDVDLAIRRSDLDRVRALLEGVGFQYRHVLGVNMFLDPDSPRASDAVHILFVDEKVRKEYAHPVPPLSPDAPRSKAGYAIAPLPSVLQMKLTSFRDIDRAHVRDLIKVGLVTPEIEDGLPPDLRARLEELKSNPDG